MRDRVNLNSPVLAERPARFSFVVLGGGLVAALVIVIFAYDITNRLPGLPPLLRALLPHVLVLLVPLITMLPWLLLYHRQQQRQKRLPTEPPVVGGASVPPPTPEPERGFVHLAAEFMLPLLSHQLPLLLGPMAVWLINQYWPQAPWWVVFAPLLLPLLWLVLRRVKQRAAPERVATQPLALAPPPAPAAAAPRPPLWQRPMVVQIVVGGLLAIVLLVAIAAALISLLVSLRLPSAQTVAWLAPLILVAAIAPFGLLLIPMLWVMAPLKQGDYAGVLRRLDVVQVWRPTDASWVTLRGITHAMMGEYAAAERLYRTTLDLERREGRAQRDSETLVNLGCALMCQGRYEEAITAIEEAITADPRSGILYAALAEVYLYADADARRALALLDVALRLKLATSWFERWIDRHILGEILARRAWALARLGCHYDAEESLARAFKVADRRFRPSLAGLHYRAAHVSGARGDRAAAHEHLRRAAALDPEGSYGRRAAAALKQIGAPS